MSLPGLFGAPRSRFEKKIIAVLLIFFKGVFRWQILCFISERGLIWKEYAFFGVHWSTSAQYELMFPAVSHSKYWW